jgi:hypothetical protein
VREREMTEILLDKAQHKVGIIIDLKRIVVLSEL